MVGVGSPLVPRTVPEIRLDDMRALARILDDPNPIHVDAAAARAAGIGDRPVVQGPASFGYVVDMLSDAFGPGAHVTELEVRLLGSVFAGDSVTAGGQLARIEPDSATCEVWLEVVGGKRVLEGTAVVHVPRLA